VKKYIFGTLAALAILFTGILIGIGVAPKQALSTQPVFPNGYEIMEAANSYRNSQGKEDLILDERLCNNISERVTNYEKTDSHEGFNEFVRTYMPPVQISEILTYSTTAEGAIKNFAGSPSHNLPLLSNSRACSYSNRGYTVIILSP
jgi:hypothetical protein